MLRAYFGGNLWRSEFFRIRSGFCQSDVIRSGPGFVNALNKAIRQQLLPTRTYQQTKQTQVPNTKCRMCDSQTETTVLSGCSKIVQSLNKARYNGMLRPIYHHLLQENNFHGSNNQRPWYMQLIPTAVVENANSKILWDNPFQLESALENGANKIEIAVLDKQGKSWLLIEGRVGRVKEKTSMKQEKYIDLRKGIKNIQASHSISQINVVLDFLGLISAVASNRPTEALASVISLAFVVYST